MTTQNRQKSNDKKNQVILRNLTFDVIDDVIYYPLLFQAAAQCIRRKEPTCVNGVENLRLMSK